MRRSRPQNSGRKSRPRRPSRPRWWLSSNYSCRVDHSKLTLNPPAAGPFQQTFHFFHAAAVKISVDRVFEATGRHGEFQRILMVRELLQSVNQAGGKTVAGADAIDNVRDVVSAAEHEFISIIQAGGPAVVRRAFGFAQGDGNRLQVGIVGEDVLRELFVLRAIEGAGMPLEP